MIFGVIMISMIKNFKLFFNLLIVAAVVFVVFSFWSNQQEIKVLNAIINRLQADSRIAQVVVMDAKFDTQTKKTKTTIKFLEYNSQGNPLTPKYFTFPDNIIQFQSLVIRFNGEYIKNSDRLRGKSAYVFWKIFALNGSETVEYEITKPYVVPQGYKINNAKNYFEDKLWKGFWQYALDNTSAKRMGIKNAQIEAPGTRFVPGLIYTIKIEHSGGMRIDSALIPEILTK